MTDKKTSENILKEYKEKEDLYKSLGEEMMTILNNSLQDISTSLYDIKSRFKEEESVKMKLERKKYNKLEDITDLYGIRLIFIYESDICYGKEIIEDNFDIDWANSSDKLDKLNVDQFGYRSIHYVVQLKECDTSKEEWKKYTDIKVEIQVRTFLQHVWASIQHDLVYKGDHIPDELERGYSRIAALLEIADEKFLVLKQEVQQYRADSKEKLELDEKLQLNSITYPLFLEDEFYLNYFSDVCTKINEPDLKVIKAPFGFDYIEELKYIGVTATSELKEELIKNKEKIIGISRYFTSEKYNSNIDNEVKFHFQAPIFYLGYIKNIESLSQFRKYLMTFSIGFKDVKVEDVYRELSKLINE